MDTCDSILRERCEYHSDGEWEEEYAAAAEHRSFPHHATPGSSAKEQERQEIDSDMQLLLKTTPHASCTLVAEGQQHDSELCVRLACRW